MKTLILMGLVVFAIAAHSYDLEKIDISDPATNMDAVKSFFDCLLDKTPCSDIYQSYKDVMHDAIQSACKQCTPEQKKFGKDVFELLKLNSPNVLDEFWKKYDPDNKLSDPLHAVLNKELDTYSEWFDEQERDTAQGILGTWELS